MRFYKIKTIKPKKPLTPAQARIHALQQNVEIGKYNYKQSVKDSDDSVKLNANITQYKNAIHKRNETTIARRGTPYNAGQAIRMKCIDLTENRIVFGGLCCNKKYL